MEILQTVLVYEGACDLHCIVCCTDILLMSGMLYSPFFVTFFLAFSEIADPGQFAFEGLSLISGCKYCPIL